VFGKLLLKEIIYEKKGCRTVGKREAGASGNDD